MSRRCDKYSLRDLLIEVHKQFPSVREAYIFGSRRHRTRSTRSDLDLLIVADEGTISEELRDFALRECPALDFFLLDGAVATSCSNGSKVRGTSKKDLIKQLNALPLWSSSKGFFDSDVDWNFEVIKGMEPMMTTLISSQPFPSKAEAFSSVQGRNDNVLTKNRWNYIKDHPLVVLAVAVIAASGFTFKVVENLRITPLQERIQMLEKDLEKITKQQNQPKVD